MKYSILVFFILAQQIFACAQNSVFVNAGAGFLLPYVEKSNCEICKTNGKLGYSVGGGYEKSYKKIKIGIEGSYSFQRLETSDGPFLFPGGEIESILTFYRFNNIFAAPYIQFPIAKQRLFMPIAVGYAKSFLNYYKVGSNNPNKPATKIYESKSDIFFSVGLNYYFFNQHRLNPYISIRIQRNFLGLNRPLIPMEGTYHSPLLTLSAGALLSTAKMD